jgi:hypothetical protein
MDIRLPLGLTLVIRHHLQHLDVNAVLEPDILAWQNTLKTKCEFTPFKYSTELFSFPSPTYGAPAIASRSNQKITKTKSKKHRKRHRKPQISAISRHLSYPFSTISYCVLVHHSTRHRLPLTPGIKTSPLFSLRPTRNTEIQHPIKGKSRFHSHWNVTPLKKNVQDEYIRKTPHIDEPPRNDRTWRWHMTFTFLNASEVFGSDSSSFFDPFSSVSDLHFPPSIHPSFDLLRYRFWFSWKCELWLGLTF